MFFLSLTSNVLIQLSTCSNSEYIENRIKNSIVDYEENCDHFVTFPVNLNGTWSPRTCLIEDLPIIMSRLLLSTSSAG